MLHKLHMLKAKISSKEVRYLVKFYKPLWSTRVSSSRLLKGEYKNDLEWQYPYIEEWREFCRRFGEGLIDF